MSKLSIQFARALADHIGADATRLMTAADELTLVAEVCATPESSAFLRNTGVAPETRATILAETIANAGVSAEVAAVVRLAILRGGKSSLIGQIAESYRRIAEEKSGVATATIESATPLSDNQLTELTDALKKMTGKDIRVTQSENAALLAGVKVAVGGDIIDLSLAGKLKKLHQTLSV